MRQDFWAGLNKNGPRGVTTAELAAAAPPQGLQTLKPCMAGTEGVKKSTAFSTSPPGTQLNLTSSGGLPKKFTKTK